MLFDEPTSASPVISQFENGARIMAQAPIALKKLPGRAINPIKWREWSADAPPRFVWVEFHSGNPEIEIMPLSRLPAGVA
jgi:hypothetical protein